MDFHDSTEQAEWRKEVRSFVHEQRPETEADGGPPQYRERRPSEAFKDWRNKLAAKGWIAPAWPKEYGGAGLGVMEQFIMNEEFAEARVTGRRRHGHLHDRPHDHRPRQRRAEEGAPRPTSSAAKCSGARATASPAPAPTSPSLQTRAVRDGDDYVINGQKIWTSGAHNADWMFMLARTDPDAPKHRGITYFLLDMKTPGVTVRPLINMANGHGFNEVFFEDVRVPAATSSAKRTAAGTSARPRWTSSARTSATPSASASRSSTTSSTSATTRTLARSSTRRP